MNKLIILLLVIIIGLGVYWYFKQSKSETNLGKHQDDVSSKVSMTQQVSVITIYDNYQVNPQLETGWGFSCLLRIRDKTILFDTGADGPTLLSNFDKLEIAPAEVDIIVLSHIHGDHVGGLESFLKKNGSVKIYIPQSFPDSMGDMITSYEGTVIDVSEAQEISPGAYSTGQLGIGIKEQSLVVNADSGLVVITGCAHPGVVNIVEQVQEMFSRRPLYLVMGGFHLGGTSQSQLAQIIDKFQQFGVQKVAPCHCSGDKAREMFEQAYGNDFIANGVGKKIVIK